MKRSKKQNRREGKNEGKKQRRRKMEPPFASFVGATRDVDLDERDFRVGFLLSESVGDWCARRATRKVCESDSLPLLPIGFAPSLSRVAAESRH